MSTLPGTSFRRTCSNLLRPKLYVAVCALGLLLVLLGAAADAPSVQPERWLADVKFLASNELKGRGNGSPELERAAAYIAEQFRQAGLQRLEENPYQPFEAVVGAELGANNRLALLAPNARSYRLRQDFLPLAFSANGVRTAALAFVGYGITAPEYSYDDYAGLDTAGRIVVVLRHEPQERDENSLFRGREFTRHSELVSKAINARNHGAAALLLVNDPANHSDDDLIIFGRISGPGDIGIPVFHIKRQIVAEWVEQAGKSLEELQRAIDRDLQGRSFLLPESLQVQLEADVQHRRAQLKNVLGYLPGNDPALREEFLVIGAHYDHLGTGELDSLAPARRGEIHNGADDNASGTAGLIELARLFSQERSRLRRSLVFMAFAGEELGLLGSAHYVEHPLLPLDRVITMLNLDMIGRMRDKKLYVGGIGTSPAFRQLLEEENQSFQFQIDYSDSGYGGSDHMSFNRKQIPVVFFFSGLHSDYHKPSDTWDKMQPQETAELLEFVRRIAWRLDTTEERPAFTPVRRARAASQGDEGEGGGYGPYFGSVPDFGSEVEGVKFAEIQPGSPAAQAGLLAGDILVEFDGKQITNLYDFTYALRAKRPDEEVPVVVLRGKEKVRARVRLAARQ